MNKPKWLNSVLSALGTCLIWLLVIVCGVAFMAVLDFFFKRGDVRDKGLQAVAAEQAWWDGYKSACIDNFYHVSVLEITPAADGTISMWKKTISWKENSVLENGPSLFPDPLPLPEKETTKSKNRKN